MRTYEWKKEVKAGIGGKSANINQVNGTVTYYAFSFRASAAYIVTAAELSYPASLPALIAAFSLSLAPALTARVGSAHCTRELRTDHSLTIATHARSLMIAFGISLSPLAKSVAGTVYQLICSFGPVTLR